MHDFLIIIAVICVATVFIISRCLNYGAFDPSKSLASLQVGDITAFGRFDNKKIDWIVLAMLMILAGRLIVLEESARFCG